MQKISSRTAIALAIPALITVVWIIFVVLFDHWPRVVFHWRSAVTMAVGSFVAGSTPQGGGAVAFPVFTKVLHVPADVARTFSLSIQAVGMVTASAIILVTRRKIDLTAVAVSGGSGVVGFFIGLFTLGDPDSIFWSFLIPPAYVKVTFTVVLAAMAYVVYLSGQRHHVAERLPLPNPRVIWGLAIFGFVGGIASAMTGSGVDVALFLFVVVLVGLHPRVGVPTSVVAMSIISTVGFLFLGLVHGQMNVQVANGLVETVGGRSVGIDMPMVEYDIYGLWLAAIPIVVWGAPLGAWLVHRLSRRAIEWFVASMALLEIVSTAIFLPELRTDPALLIYTLITLVSVLVLVAVAERYRHQILGIPVPAEV